MANDEKYMIHMSFRTSLQRSCNLTAGFIVNYPPLASSFYHLPCEGKKLYISWGHNGSADTAVMTVEEYVSAISQKE